jgi:DNA mismatch repair ATPase MutS
LIQILELHKAIDYTMSATGSAVLLRSLIQPGTDQHYIRSKQEALSEIASNDRLCSSLKNFIYEYSRGESALYKFFNKGLYAMFPYADIKSVRQSGKKISAIIPTIPRARSSYLRTLLSFLDLYRESPIDRMMSAPIYMTFTGPKSDKEVRSWTLKQKFVPHRLTQWILAGPAIAVMPYLFSKAGYGQIISPLMSSIGLAWTGLYGFYCLFIKPVKDTEHFIEPFRKRCVDDHLFNRAIDAIGMIDELLSFRTFAVEFKHPATLPKIADKTCHFFEATGLRNPVLAKDNMDFVPNRVCMNRKRLTFITGPNSGGKTTICKSIIHNQLLAQIGSYVAAETATINIAERIWYQAPKFDGLQDDEGRFGTELSRTRDIFFSTTPKSLVILDELAEGTTYEERLHTSYNILNDFCTIGNSTILVTHNHSLVDRFMHEKKGQCVMVELKGDLSSYRIVPGISRISHADKIAEKINFTDSDRHRYMREKGYL